MEKLPIDYFNNNFKVFAFADFGPLPVADGFEENIRRAVSDIQHSHIALGYALIAYAESHTFSNCLFGFTRDCREYAFFNRCFVKFNLDKSSVSRHVNVVYRFGDGKDGLRSSFRNRSFSYLCELLPLSEQDIDHCLIHCNTVAEVRAYKKTLVATSQQENKQELNKAESNSDEFVATSRFDIKLIYSTDFNSEEVFKYLRFCGMTVQKLCDRYLELEEKYNELKASIDITNKSGVTV